MSHRLLSLALIAGCSFSISPAADEVPKGTVTKFEFSES